MATSLLGINSSGTESTLNSTLVNKLKESETTSRTSSLDTNIKKIETSKELLNTFNTSLSLFLSSLNENEDKFSATTSGENIIFDSYDEDLITKGFSSYDVTSLAKKDVYQSDTFTDASSLFGTDSFTVQGNSIDTTGKTFQEVSDEINNLDGVSASIQSISSTESRIVINSLSGEDNSLEISSPNLTQMQVASNLKIKIDGVNYEFNENSFKKDGLKIEVNSLGQSTINIGENEASLSSKVDTIISKYNDLVSFTDDTILYNSEYDGDKSAIRSFMQSIKESFFENNLFTSGFELDKDGNLSKGDLPEDKTNILEFIDDVKDRIDTGIGAGGILYSLGDNLDSRKTTLEDERTKALTTIESKYDDLSSQFTSYNTIISSFESNFASLKLLINSYDN